MTPPVEVVGSLAVQMNQRAIDEERVSLLCSCQWAFKLNPSRRDNSANKKKPNAQRRSLTEQRKNWMNKKLHWEDLVEVCFLLPLSM